LQAKKFQIFVSSTYTDLVRERQEAIKAIVDLGHMPSGMEGFPAIDMAQFEYIKKVIDQCDYYVLIIGDRYGSLAPDGISFTEKEYHYAIKTGKVVLAFVKDEPATDPKLSAFKEHVKTDRMVLLWKAGDDLKYPVSRSLREAFEEHPREGWVRAQQPNPVRPISSWLSLLWIFASVLAGLVVASVPDVRERLVESLVTTFPSLPFSNSRELIDAKFELVKKNIQIATLTAELDSERKKSASLPPAPKPNDNKARKAELQKFYLEGGALLSTPLAKDISADDFKKYANDCNAWLNRTVQWIGVNMGDAAKARFLDTSGSLSFSYSNAVNAEHEKIIGGINNFRKNLQVLIVEFDAWDSKG
jgi:hypothetical protein